MYQALYRKWRPMVFTDVYGQSHVTQTLIHELESGKLSHAYLFTGSRGTGKTTCAKILSKAVNCLSPVNGNPCNECEMCREIDNGSVLDVIEIDAASNNGVDNIRDLREEANFTPVKAKYRVYIIDEVHMLSIGAFNALLKILEEPPSYVIFILATTEVHKLPATILSRCQRFDFKHIEPAEISRRLQYVAQQEQIELDEDASMLISRIADGALRDALSLLDRCSANGERVTSELVGLCAGLAGRDYLFNMADLVLQRDTSCALELVNSLNSDSCSMEQLCTDLINHFRNLLISKTVKNTENLIICSKEELTQLKNQAAGFTLESILNIVSVLEEALLNIKRNLDKRLETEMAIIKLCNPSVMPDVSSLSRRISELEAALSSGQLKVSASKTALAAQTPPVLPTAQIEKPVDVIQADTIAPRATSPVNTSNDEVINSETVSDAPEQRLQTQAPPSTGDGEKTVFKLWPEVLTVLKETSKPLTGILVGSRAFVSAQTIYIKSDNAAFTQFLNIPAYYSCIESAVEKVSGKNYKISCFTSQQQEKKSDPLSGLLKKIDNLI